MRKEWCQAENIVVPKTSAKNPNRVRCTVCKKRFEPIVRVGWGGHVIVYLPKHKRILKYDSNK